MKKLDKNIKTITTHKIVLSLNGKLIFLLTIQLCLVLVSCSSDDQRGLKGSIVPGDTDVSGTVYCSDLNPDAVTNPDEVKTYTSVDDNTGYEIIWGFSNEEIGLDTEFIKEEDLKNLGIEIISVSEDNKVFEVKYLEGFKGIFLGYKVNPQGSPRCNTSFYQESSI